MLENFDKEINNYRNSEALHEAVASIMEDCRNNAKWLCDRKRDEDGKLVEDENGNDIYIEPEKDTYKYRLMEAYLNIARALPSLLK